MATATTRPTNGVSYGYLHTVTATDVTDGYVIIDFQVDYNLAAVVMITDGDPNDINQTAPHVALGDAEITYPAEGQVKVGNGDSTFTLVEDYIIHVIANRRSA